MECTAVLSWGDDFLKLFYYGDMCFFGEMCQLGNIFFYCKQTREILASNVSEFSAVPILSSIFLYFHGVRFPEGYLSSVARMRVQAVLPPLSRKADYLYVGESPSPR